MTKSSLVPSTYVQIHWLQNKTCLCANCSTISIWNVQVFVNAWTFYRQGGRGHFYFFCYTIVQMDPHNEIFRHGQTALFGAAFAI